MRWRCTTASFPLGVIGECGSVKNQTTLILVVGMVLVRKVAHFAIDHPGSCLCGLYGFLEEYFEGY